MNLQLPLKAKWFNMTKEGIKKEDYRDITPYWCARLLLQNGKKEPQSFWKAYLDAHKEDTLKSVLENYCDTHRIAAIKFDKNIMTLGYPKRSDKMKILNIQHKGIEIRTGNTKWGAKEGELYFVIIHGEFN